MKKNRVLNILIIAGLTLTTVSTGCTTEEPLEDDLFSSVKPDEVDSNPKPTEVIEIDLKDLVTEIDSKDEKTRYAAGLKYNGKVLKVTGRTSGMDANGMLYLQVRPTENAVQCYGLPSDFLLSVNKEDIVEITGTFELVNADAVFTRYGELRNCTGVKMQ